jgi:hypothetical protein
MWKKNRLEKGEIEAFIISEKIDLALSSLEALNLRATFYESRGIGIN